MPLDQVKQLPDLIGFHLALYFLMVEHLRDIGMDEDVVTDDRNFLWGAARRSGRQPRRNPRGTQPNRVPDTSWLVSDGFCERRISLLGRYTSAGATCMGTRSVNHTGCPDDGDDFRPHPPDGPTVKKWNRPCGKSMG